LRPLQTCRQYPIKARSPPKNTVSQSRILSLRINPLHGDLIVVGCKVSTLFVLRTRVFWVVTLLLKSTNLQDLKHQIKFDLKCIINKTQYKQMKLDYIQFKLQIKILTIHAMYVWRNTEERSCSHCWSGKAISITHSECVIVALVIQHAVSMRHIVSRGLPLSAVFFLIIS